MADRPEIVPDTKDWTWVLEQPCPECGFAADELAGTAVGTLTRSNAAAWQQVLTRSDVRDRPAPTTWSPLEYACHVRDVHVLFDQRLTLMLAEDDPQFANWDQDETAVRERYGEQDPAVVSDELVAAAATIAARFDGVTGEQWQRTARRSDGAVFTVETFGRYFAHDYVHHLHDVDTAESSGTTGTT
jgi:hypothetical protein